MLANPTRDLWVVDTPHIIVQIHNPFARNDYTQALPGPVWASVVGNFLNPGVNPSLQGFLALP